MLSDLNIGIQEQNSLPVAVIATVVVTVVATMARQ
jgi:hypothetical protein